MGVRFWRESTIWTIISIINAIINIFQKQFATVSHLVCFGYLVTSTTSKLNILADVKKYTELFYKLTK